MTCHRIWRRQRGATCWNNMEQLCSPINCSPSGLSIHDIFQAGILEWVAISSSRGSSQPRDQTYVSCISCTNKWILYHWATCVLSSLFLAVFSTRQPNVHTNQLLTLQYREEKSVSQCLGPLKVPQSCQTLCNHLGLNSPWNSPGQSTGVGSLSLLQGIFPTQGSNPVLQHCSRILYQLSHKGRPGASEHSSNSKKESWQLSQGNGWVFWAKAELVQKLDDWDSSGPTVHTI